jgi:hypothetical protein
MALVLAVVGAAASLVSMDVILIRPTGFGMLGRYGFPAIVLAVLLAADVLRARWATAAWRPAGDWRLVPTVVCVALPAVMACLHLLGWWLNARRYAVGMNGPLGFLADPAWEPAHGWAPWLALAVAGSLLLAASLAPARLGLAGGGRSGGT